MKYLIVGLLLINFIGCGSSNTVEKEIGDTIEKPVSPKPQDSSKKPPSIPNI